MDRPTGGEVVALVPMRHHSERVPEKNYRMVAGRPLFAYILETLTRCTEVSRIVVDTDSPILREGVGRLFPNVQILERPADLRADDVPMNDIVVHDAQMVEAGWYVQTHSTNPLLRPETISTAIRTLRGDPEHDSLFSVSRLQARLWSEAMVPLNHDPSRLIRTQDLAPLFVENSCLYIVSREALLHGRNRVGERPRMFPIEGEEAWDIDEELDLAVAECLLKRRAAAMPAGPS